MRSSIDDGPDPTGGSKHPVRRASIRLAAVFVLGLTAGGVAFVWLSRAPAPGGAKPGAASSKAAAFSFQGKPMPEGCEVETANPPSLVFVEVPGNRLLLGAFKQGEHVERTVTLRNAGTGVLCIRDIETGCGCVKAAWEGDPHIQPSTSKTLSIRIDTTEREGDQEKWVTIYTNDPKQRFGAVLTVVLDIRLGVVVVTPMGAPGPRLLFGVRAPGEAATAVLRLKCPRDAPEWTVLGIESLALPEASRPTFRWTLDRVESDDAKSRAYDLRVTHPGRTEPGHDVQPVRITTSHSDRPEIRLDAELTVNAR